MAPVMCAHQAPTQFASGVKAIGIEPLLSEQAAQTATAALTASRVANSKGVRARLSLAILGQGAIILPTPDPPDVSLQPMHRNLISQN
jgi:hypothetical protein